MSELALQAHQQEVNDKTAFGFWTYLMTDLVLFASLFATFVVLRNSTFGGPSGHELFEMPGVLAETLVLLTSSFTCGLGLLAAQRRDKTQVLLWFAITFALGATFLTLELSEFHKFISEGNSWQRSGFLSAFFTLVGTHGLHITAGLLWMVVMWHKVLSRGFNERIVRRLGLLALFWHFLDVVWIFIFTIVYLMGAAA